ncbi:MAG: hypothetical protein VKN72_05775 [Nostocales cyanobacterium 94392]|nr:hypothetical protein [Nostocales cyanobacterium 94392]
MASKDRMNIKFAEIVNLCSKQINVIGHRGSNLFWISRVADAEVDLEDLQKVVIDLKDAVDVMKPLEMSTSKIQLHDLTTVFVFLESARNTLFRTKIPKAAKAMDKVIKNLRKVCKIQSEKQQKKLISEILNGLNQLLCCIEKSISHVTTPIVTHMTYEQLLSKLTAYSSNAAF